MDDVRLAPHQDSAAHFALKNLHIRTVVVEHGRPRARIVVPASGEYDALGREIAARIRQLAAADAPLVRDTEFDLCRDQRLDENLIVLGNRTRTE